MAITLAAWHNCCRFLKNASKSFKKICTKQFNIVPVEFVDDCRRFVFYTVLVFDSEFS